MSHSDEGSDQSDYTKMRFFSPSGEFTLSFCAAEMCTLSVSDLRMMVSKKLNWPYKQVLLLRTGKPLDESEPLNSITNLDSVNISVTRDRSSTVKLPEEDLPLEESTPRETPFLKNIISNGSSNDLLKIAFGGNNSDQTPVNQDFGKSNLGSEPKVGTSWDPDVILSHIMDSPQTSEILANPKLIQQIMRNNDRQLSKIESLPRGLNVLSGLYQSVNDSMSMNYFDKSTEGLNNEFAKRLGVKKRQEGVINEEPLPNPWTSKAQNGARETSNRSKLPLFKGNSNSMSDFPIFNGAQRAFPGKLGTGQSSSSFIGMLQMFANMGGLTPEDAKQTAGSGDSLASQYHSSAGETSPKQKSTESTEIAPASLNRNEEASSTKQDLVQKDSKEEQDNSSHISQNQTYSIAEERYASEIGLLMGMGFSKKEDCISALLAAGGSIEGAVEYLTCASHPQNNGKN